MCKYVDHINPPHLSHNSACHGNNACKSATKTRESGSWAPSCLWFRGIRVCLLQSYASSGRHHERQLVSLLEGVVNLTPPLKKRLRMFCLSTGWVSGRILQTAISGCLLVACCWDHFVPAEINPGGIRWPSPAAHTASHPQHNHKTRGCLNGVDGLMSGDIQQTFCSPCSRHLCCCHITLTSGLLRLLSLGFRYELHKIKLQILLCVRHVM